MMQRYDLVRVKYTDDDIIDKVDNGDYVLYTDHLAVIAEKDREISRLRKEADRYRKVSRLRPNAVQMVMRQHLLR